MVCLLVLAACAPAQPAGVTSAVVLVEPPSPPPASDASAPTKPAAPDDMVAIPAGTFMMGSDDGRIDERPVHSVEVAAFAIDRVPVTVAAYQQCVSAGVCIPNLTTVFSGEHDHESPSTDCNDGAKGRGDHPINCVDLLQAALYCEWLYKRLPTEEEWEYAARGTDGRTDPWGNEEPGAQACWDRGLPKRGTCAVGSFPRGASPFGLLDMAGNVGEWTWSKYSDDYSKTGSPSANVTRGGSWSDADPSSLRAAGRRRHNTRDRDSDIGFRCAR